MSNTPRLRQLKIITSIRSTVQAFLTVWIFPSVQGNTKPCQIIKHAKISYSTVSIVFHKFLCGTYQNSQNRGTSKPYLKAEVLQVPQKVWTMLVWYLLMGISILVYSCTEWGTSEIYLYLKDNNLSFYRVSLKSETKDTRP